MQQQSVKYAEKNILVVEDSYFCYLLLEENLKPLGFNLYRANNDIETWSLLNLNCVFHLVLMDVVLPRSINGIDLSRDIKKKFPVLPIIILTALHIKKEADSMPGVYDAYFTKPYSTDSLINKIFSFFPEASE